MKYMLQESATEKGDTKAKAQLMRTITNAVKSDEMDKVTMEGIYYQPFPVCTEITDKENLHAFAEVENEINVKTHRTLKKLWQGNEQELEPADETKEIAF